MGAAQLNANQLARAVFGARVDYIAPDPHYFPSGNGIRVEFDNGAKLWFERFDVLAPREDRVE